MMPIAKVTRPLLSGTVPRRRLFSLLDRGREGAIVWVDGPPGCGKTTLVSGYLEARKLPCLWYDLDRGDADPATFFLHLAAAVRMAAPRIRRSMPSLTPENLPDVPSFSRRYFQELFTRLPANAVLVLDNFHRVPDGSPFHDVIREGLSRLPPGTSAIVISRSKIPPALAGLRAVRPLRFLHWNDLRLTLEEAGAIIRKRGGKSPAPAAVQQLQKSADGWAAGLVLLLARTPAEETGTHSLRHEAPYEIFEYFGEEIFRRQSPGIRNFLMRSAFLPAMTGDATSRLTGREGAGEVLSWLHRNNYFTEKHPALEPVYRYHGLFRKFLLERAREAYPPEEMSRLYREAAGILAESGQADEAAALFHASGDLEGLRGLIQAEAVNLLRQGRGHTLQGWLESIPAGEREADPWLLYWMGSCRFPRDLAGSRAFFEKAFDGFREPDGASGKYLSWAGVVETVLAEWDDFSLLDRRIDWLERRGGMRSPFPSVEVEARVCVAMANALVFRRPQHAEIHEWIRRALRLARDVADQGTRLQARLAAVNYYLWIGDRGRTDLVMEELPGMARSGGTPPAQALATKLMEALTAVCTEGDPDASLRHVEEGLRISDATGVRGWDLLLSSTGACAALTKGDDRGAQKFLENITAMLSPARRHGYSMYHYLATWAHLSLGETLQAMPHAEEAVSVAVETGVYFPEVLYRLALAQVRHEKGDAAGADEELSRALSLAVAGRSRILEFMGRLAQAHFLLDRGSGAEGLAALREAMAVGREGEYWSLFWWWRPKMIARLCAAALEADIEPGYVREFIRRRGLRPDPSMMEVESWPWPIRIYTLGRFTIVRNGEPVRFGRKPQQKPLRMLMALIALGGRNVPEEKITEILWGDAEGDLAHLSFNTTLRRLRQLLGNEEAVVLTDGKVTLSNQYCWVDGWAFERIVGRIERLSDDVHRRNHGPAIERLARTLLSLYKGRFLDGETFSGCLDTQRQRHRSKFLRCVSLAGRFLENEGHLEEAVAWYQRAVEADPIAEELYRRLIDCYRKMGRKAEALATYKRCKKALMADVGIVPSSETRSLVHSLDIG